MKLTSQQTARLGLISVLLANASALVSSIDVVHQFLTNNFGLGWLCWG